MESFKKNNKHAGSNTDLDLSLDLRSADKDLKAVTPDKSKACVTTFTKNLVTKYQLL